MLTCINIMENLSNLSTKELQLINASTAQLLEKKKKRMLWNNVVEAIEIYLTESGDSSIQISDVEISSDDDDGFFKEITLDNFESIFLKDSVCGMIEL